MGMKNAATPILAACILTNEECTIENVPVITDVLNLLDLLGSLGVAVQRDGHTVRIHARELQPERLDRKLVQSMRSSILLVGPLLARCGTVRMPMPGGCIIGNRPIDAHTSAFAQINAIVTPTREDMRLDGRQLKSATVILPEFSVTATENLLMAASALSGTTIIKMAAAEPHVQDLSAFLAAMGATISGIGTHTLTVQGSKRLRGVRHTLIPDTIEVGTFLVAAAATRSTLTLKGVALDHLDAVLTKAREIGIAVESEGSSLTVRPTPLLSSFKLQTLPYPGFPTDLQAPFAVLATQAQGTSLIHDPMYEGRMGYVQELVKMGANAVVCDPHRVLITGPTPLYGQEIKSVDLRAGATVVLAALAAQGETVIADAQMIDRGYERLDERLRQVGADISREEEKP